MKQVDISGFKHLYPFKSHYLDINGLKYHYISEGSGEPVVMVHGNPTWSFYFRNLIKALSPSYHAIAIDHIGCGLSEKPDTNQYDFRLKNRIDDLETLIDTLNLKSSITLVLHDWGGMIGLAYALRHPEKINRIVLSNTTGFLPPGGKRMPLRLWLLRNLRPFATTAVLRFNLFAYAAQYMCSYKGLSKMVRNGLTAPYNSYQNRLATLKFVQDIPLCEKDPSYEIVKSVDDNLHTLSSIPMLICWGKHDFVFDDAYLAEWYRRFPKAEFHEFNDAGHYLFEDLPDKMTNVINDFLKKQETSS